MSELKKQAAEYPELADPDDADSSVADGRSTAAVSAVGTPLTSAAGSGQQKLKLTFNATGNKDGAMTNGTASDDE